MSCSLGLNKSYFGRPDCAGWLEEQKRNKYVGEYYSSKCGSIYRDVRGQQRVEGTGY